MREYDSGAVSAAELYFSNENDESTTRSEEEFVITHPHLLSYPKDMYVKVCGTRERACIRVLGYMYVINIREYIYYGNVPISVPFSREGCIDGRVATYTMCCGDIFCTR
jgi:hypothetical protein